MSLFLIEVEDAEDVATEGIKTGEETESGNAGKFSIPSSLEVRMSLK